MSLRMSHVWQERICGVSDSRAGRSILPHLKTCYLVLTQKQEIYKYRGFNLQRIPSKCPEVVWNLVSTKPSVSDL
jgi:hypothetical protein